ncbi:Sucrose-6-phosphate hydrolase [Limosilactobacillus fermentum CECT 5716]|nr:Sucrose-6-phosphate hydrolase [Limosilactobacillus fermentum CECT 5716]
MDKDGQVTKLDHELFVNPPHFTELRDPQLLVKDGHYYALLGAQRTADKTGVADLWESDQLESGWHEVGEVDLGQSDLGYMVECPNYVDVDGRAVMIFCPQGLDHQTAPYQNIYPNMYLTGQDFDLTAPRLVNPDETLTNLDEGFDVYATQAFNAPDGTAYAVSWVGLPDTTYPTDDHNWANVMSQVKELHYRDGHLYQTPVEAMADLRHTHHATIFTGQPTVIKEDAGQQFELQVTIEPNQAGTLTLAGDQSLEHGVFLNFDTTAGQLVIDRAKAGQPVAEDHGTTRTLTVPGHQELKLDIFVDHSLVEIFVNDGYKVATLRYFADQAHGQVAFTNPTKATGTLWPIKPY